MLVWINGPFGGGKTQVAHELARRLPGSAVCDPELVGFGLRRMMPPGPPGDFQDLPVWRHAVHEVLQRAAGDFPGHVLIPMTLVVPDYFDQIVGRLRATGCAITHVSLLAQPETVRRRLRERAVGRVLSKVARPGWMPRREEFAFANFDRCLAALEQPRFATQIRTDGLTVPETAERIARTCGLDLTPRLGGALRQRVREVGVGARHVRRD